MSKEIISLQLENIKKIKAITIKPEGNFVEISGKNGQGKSTVLDAIWWVLKGKDNIQQMPVRQGEEKALIRLELNNLIIERKFKINEVGGDYTTTISVMSKEGAKFSSPQAILDKFTGILGFDPLSFMRMAPKAQYDTLRRYLKTDVDIDQIDLDYKAIFEQRTDVNREVKRLQAQAEGIKVENPPAEKVNVAALMGELQAAQEKNNKLQKVKNNLDSAGQIKNSKQAQIKECETKILNLRSDIENLDVDIRKGLEYIKDNKTVDTTELQTKISEADGINQAYDRHNSKLKLVSERIEQEHKADALTAEMEALQKKKKQAIEAANLPVKGLEFGNNELLFNGAPLAQLSAAEQLKLSMDIATAENPDLKVILLKDASLLDDESLAYIKQRAEDSGYQIWAERVDTTGAMGFVIEDGELKS